MHGHPRDAIRLGRVFTAILATIALGSFWISNVFELPLISILFGAFSAQISIAPAVLGTLLLGSRAPGSITALSSIICGFLAGLWATIVALNNADWSLYAPLFSLSSSLGVYLIGWRVTELK